MNSPWDLYTRNVYSDASLWINEHEYRLHRHIMDRDKSKLINELLENMLATDHDLKINDIPVNQQIIEDVLHLLYDNRYKLSDSTILSVSNVGSYVLVLKFFGIDDEYINNYEYNAKKLMNRSETDCIYFPIKLNLLKEIMRHFKDIDTILFGFELNEQTNKIDLTITSLDTNRDVKIIKPFCLDITIIQSDEPPNMNVTLSHKYFTERLDAHNNNFDTVLVLFDDTYVSAFSTNKQKNSILNTASKIFNSDGIHNVSDKHEKTYVATINDSFDLHKKIYFNEKQIDLTAQYMKYPSKVFMLKIEDSTMCSLITHENKQYSSETYQF